jgi:hypothetical protein
VVECGEQLFRLGCCRRNLRRDDIVPLVRTHLLSSARESMALAVASRVAAWCSAPELGRSSLTDAFWCRLLTLMYPKAMPGRDAFLTKSVRLNPQNPSPGCRETN